MTDKISSSVGKHGRPTQASDRIPKWNESDQTERMGKCVQREDSNEPRQGAVAFG